MLVSRDSDRRFSFLCFYLFVCLYMLCMLITRLVINLKLVNDSVGVMFIRVKIFMFLVCEFFGFVFIVV